MLPSISVTELEKQHLLGTPSRGPNWGPSWNPSDYHSTIVLRGLREEGEEPELSPPKDSLGQRIGLFFSVQRDIRYFVQFPWQDSPKKLVNNQFECSATAQFSILENWHIIIIGIMDWIGVGGLNIVSMFKQRETAQFSILVNWHIIRMFGDSSIFDHSKLS